MKEGKAEYIEKKKYPIYIMLKAYEKNDKILHSCSPLVEKINH